MKKLILFLGGIFLSAGLFAQTIEFTLNKALTVGCGSANPLTDMTKSVDVVIAGNKGTLTYASLNCKKTIEGMNMGVVNQSAQGLAFLDEREKKGFIIEKNEKVILFTQKEGKYVAIGAGHIDKKMAKSLNPESDQAAYTDFFANIDKLMVEAKRKAREDKLNAIAAADSMSTFLDKQEVLKDSRGMSGIYYSTFPIKLEFSLPSKEIPEPYAKKFLVNYDESSPNPILSINTQYAYETSDRTKWVKRATFWLDSYWKNVLEKKGVFATSEADNVDNTKYQFYTHGEKKDLQGNSIMGEDWLTNFDGNLFEAEPGILLILGNWQSFYEEDLNKAKKFGIVAILYKPEKANEVAKYTNDYAWDKIHELREQIKAAGRPTTATLPVETFKDTKINAEALTLAKDYAAKNHPKEQVQYTYIAGNDWNIVRDKNSGAIIKRTLRIIVVVKIGNQCAFENGSITQNYDGSSYGRSIWGGSGAPVYFDCKDLNKYK
jgi:hypothetical protein